MNIQEENSARYFRVQSEREQTLVISMSINVILFFISDKICKHVMKITIYIDWVKFKSYHSKRRCSDLTTAPTFNTYEVKSLVSVKALLFCFCSFVSIL